MKQIQANFQGYWIDANKKAIPTGAGVYCVYACNYYPANNEVVIRKLLYIGESLNVNSRIGNHDRDRDWRAQLLPGETLCFSFANIGYFDRMQCEAALIFYHKPPLNDEYLYGFPYETAMVHTYGQNCYLNSSFAVN